jgi:phenylpropionate dioxygenase-like ring-hydroxylating dioxygenase large terminal subunit
MIWYIIIWLCPLLYNAFTPIGPGPSGKKHNYFPIYKNPNPVTKPQPVLQPTDTLEERELDRRYRQHWFVIEESQNIKVNTPYKSMIREKEYVFWKDSQNQFCAMDNYCNHRGADLSSGKIRRTRVVCPYHGAEFNRKGELCKIPGMEIETENRSKLKTCFYQDTYPILEMNGWVYINTISKQMYECKNHTIFIEPESRDQKYHCLYLKSVYEFVWSIIK